MNRSGFIMKIMACKKDVDANGNAIPGEILGIYYQVAKV
jgi:hypothetical protein